MAGLSALLMWGFIQREMRPLESFTRAARRIAAGQYAEIAPVLSHGDEWRTLSDAFQQMLGELTLRESRLRENAQRIEAVLRSMIEGVLAIDAAGTVVLANNAACAILKLDRSELLHRKLLEVVRIPALGFAIAETQLHRAASQVEFQTIVEPRKQISAHVAAMSHESYPGVAIVLHDVTELRRLESTRRDFVANVSHELKTPLAAIIAYAETLRMGALDDPDKGPRFLQRIEDQAALLNELVGDLLTLARVESSQAAFDISDVLVDAVCRDAVDRFAECASAVPVALTYQPNAVGLTARGNADALRTILDNLLSNAIRYTPAGGSVTVRSRGEEGWAVIEVSDTGIGIDAEHQTRVFERFYRVDPARSRASGGTGLGLSIVKHLTQSLGGAVRLDSSPGSGSTFAVRLPKDIDDSTMPTSPPNHSANTA